MMVTASSEAEVMPVDSALQPRHFSQMPAQSQSARPLVLHVRVVTGHGGGPEKTILNSPRFLRPLGYDAKLAYLHPPQDPGFESIRRRGAALDADVISVPDSGPLDWRVLQRLVRLCREQRVAIWHGHDYKSNLLGLLVRTVWPMQLVTTLHGWTNLTGRTSYYVKIDKWCLKYYRASICVSDDLVEECRRLGIREERRYLVHNAIDTDDYSRTRSIAEAKRELGINERAILVGAVGRLSPEKGFDLLIRAIAKLRQAGMPVELAIAGDGNARPELERLIAQLAGGSYVRLLGHVADPRRLYEAMDVYALSSLREGLPNVLLEAMALEVPVVATRVAGVPKMIADGEDGLLVEAGSLESLANALTQVANDANLRRNVAAAGRQTVEKRFSFRRRMERIVEIYDEVLGIQRAQRLEQEAATCR